MLDMFSKVSVPYPTVPTVEMMNSNNTSVGDIHITINQADIKSDTDIDELARKVGRSFTKELSKSGLTLPGYAF